jgi:hypothetical protein
MAEFLRTTGHWSEALRLHGTALAAALTRSDLGGQAQARLDTAMINCLRGDYEQAEAGFRTALELVRELRDRQGEGIALHGLGRYVYAGEDLPEGNEPRRNVTALPPIRTITIGQQRYLQRLLSEANWPDEKLCEYFSIDAVAKLPMAEFDRALSAVKQAKRRAA